jgi:hypothetical protein
MNNVGDTVTLSFPDTLNLPVVYVWELWDGTVETTTTSTLDKVLNMGGTLGYTVTAMSDDGQKIARTGSVTVNRPPEVLGSPTISTNDVVFPYTTTINVEAIDPDGGALTFTWVNRAGLTLASATIDSSNQLLYRVTGQDKLVLTISDPDGGITTVPFELRGISSSSVYASTVSYPAAGASNAQAQQLLAESVVSPVQRIGLPVEFTAYTSSADAGTLTLEWSFPPSRGWVINSANVADPVPVNTTLLNGAIKSVVIKPTILDDGFGNQLVETPGQKVAVLKVTNQVTGRTVENLISVNLVENQPVTEPVVTTNLTHNTTDDTWEATVGQIAHFTASATDGDNDMVTYQWEFTVDTETLYFWGKTVALDTSKYAYLATPTNQFGGIVRASDRGGLQTVATLKPIVMLAV